MHLDERKSKEIEHSDRRRSIVRAYEYHTDASPDQLDEKYVEGGSNYERHFSNMKFYSITRSSVSCRDALLFDRVKGAVALDYCCGNGEVAVEMAKRGARKVMGIDISQVAIENAKELAESQGVGKICEFRVMDAEHTEFADNTFDIIHEYGALHHLELKSAFSELPRILKRSGKLVCTEALRHNPLIHWYRRRTPHLRTAWEIEHILGVEHLDVLRAHFDRVEVKFFHLLALAAVPFRKTFLFRPLRGFLDFVDDIVLRHPWIGKYAWMMVITSNEPRKRVGPS